MKISDWFNSVEKNTGVSSRERQIWRNNPAVYHYGGIFSSSLHKTSIGRKIYAIGTTERAAVYSGVNTKCLLFSFSGLMAGLAGILTMSRLLLVRFDRADGGELDIVTMVLPGGATSTAAKGASLEPSSPLPSW